MNRRGFLEALVAVPLAGLVAVKAPAWRSRWWAFSAPVRSVRFTTLMFHGAEICEDQYCPPYMIYLCSEDQAALSQLATDTHDRDLTS